MDAVEITRRFETTAANTFRLSLRPPLFVKGDGAFLFTADGVPYLDLVGGSGTSLLGHGNEAHKKAILKTLESGILHTGTRLPSPYRAELYKAISKILPAHLTRIHFANSGAEAIETAIKVAIKKTNRKRMISFSGGYHGRTLGALAVTHSESLRLDYEPWESSWVDFVPYASSDDEANSSLEKLENLLKDRQVAAIVIEAVQGVSGVRGPNIKFLRGAENLAKTYGTLFIADEIWTGFGRAGRWFAFNHANIAPDLVTMGKGLSASLPLSAVAGREEILTSWSPGSHTSTFQGNPLAVAAATATIETLHKEKLVERACKVLEPLMKSALSGLPHRVIGAQAAIDMSSNKASIELQNKAMELKILIYGGGLNGECVMLLPPLNIAENVLEQAILKLREIM